MYGKECIGLRKKKRCRRGVGDEGYKGGEGENMIIYEMILSQLL